MKTLERKPVASMEHVTADGFMLSRASVAKVDNLKDASKPWSVMWQTAGMTAPAFWYYGTEEEAMKAAAGIVRP